MIYTVTFNPSLDYIVSMDGFEMGRTNRTTGEQMFPGGKGINVSIVLGNLGIENTALGFTAGFTGEQIEREVQRMGLLTDFIRIDRGLSRINVKLKDYDGTEINGMGPEIGQAHVNALYQKLERLETDDVLVLAGSIPKSLPDSIYSDILARLQTKGVLFVVDATKDLLLNVLQYKPFLIKPNNHELGEIFQVTLDTREAVVPYAKRPQEKGAQNVLVSMAGQGPSLWMHLALSICLQRRREILSTQWVRGIPWSPDSLQDGRRRRIMAMHSAWEFRQEARVHSRSFWRQGRRLSRYMRH